jgi:predicted peroxiredoxin
MAKKYLIVATQFADNPERATLPWVVATSAQALDHEVVLFLQGVAVKGATKNGPRELPGPGCLPSIEELREIFLSEGGKIYYCGPCIAGYHLDYHDLIEGAEPAGTTFIVEQAENAIVFTY